MARTTLSTVAESDIVVGHDFRNREKQQLEIGVTGGARFVRRGGATPRARGRLSAAVGCTEPTIRGSPAVTATRSARLSQPWRSNRAALVALYASLVAEALAGTAAMAGRMRSSATGLVLGA
jgi:hypothetical protein